MSNSGSVPPRKGGGGGGRLITDGLSLGVGSQKLSLNEILLKISLEGYSQQISLYEVSYKIIFGEIYYNDELYSSPQCLGTYDRQVLVWQLV